MKISVLLILTLASASCSTMNSTPTTSCFSLSCIAEDVERDMRKRCMSHLFMYPRQLQAAIDAEYRYPLVNSDNYSNWTRMGNSGPSPHEWCRGYARAKVQAGYALTQLPQAQ